LGAYSNSLGNYLVSKKVWHHFVEFDEPVRTVEQAASKVPVQKIVKSIVMIDSEDSPFLAIVRTECRVSFKKIKRILDVRLTTPLEVLKSSGYPAGGVPPFSRIQRVLLDPAVLENETCFVGGGDVDKLLEVRTQDIVATVRPNIADISQESSSG
jgi:prolyl-tRNA editing enzyme YbaK/EbsC (Cys-tRNA(Pro) deacylase)